MGVRAHPAAGGALLGLCLFPAALALDSRPLAPPSGQGGPGFELQPPERTGVDFRNPLAGDAYLSSVVAHNGSGLALGDVDGDGRPDIYFCALQGPNRLYLNRGGWRFEEVPAGEAACPRQWSTGAALADIDGDGDPDLLVGGVASGVRLFLNDGTGVFSERSGSGLSRDASATSLALADVDSDGDLDLYCAHYIDVMYSGDPSTRYQMALVDGSYRVTHVNGRTVAELGREGRFEVSSQGRQGRLVELPESDQLYLNQGQGRFLAVGGRRGTFLDGAGEPLERIRDWGLAASFADLDHDGLPDLYVCNDNASPDRVWINSGGGTFREAPAWMLRHTSRSSMGVDFADLDHDGNEDIVVLDMMGREHARRMTQLVKQHSGAASILAARGRPRYNRNTLHLARGDGTYAETALAAGVAATGWSWCPIFLDVDLDGHQDLLASNGFAFDVMDRDSHDRIRSLSLQPGEGRTVRRHHPPLPERNVAFRNRGDATFEEAGWGFGILGISHGMALADLDGDGDQDVVVNQLNQEALLLRNLAGGPRIAVRLEGRPPNRSGIGARIRFLSGGIWQSRTLRAGGRYLSGDAPLATFAVLGGGEGRLEVEWPGGTVARADGIRPGRLWILGQEQARPQAPGPSAERRPLFVSAGRGLGPRHSQPPGTDPRFHPHAAFLDLEGPGLGWMDRDGDGWEDLWVAGGSGSGLSVLLNHQGRGMRPAAGDWPRGENQGAVAHWPAGPGTGLVARRKPGLVRIVGAERTEEGPRLEDQGVASLSVADVDGDGALDLFVGAVPSAARYPEPVPSHVYLNKEGRLVRSELWSASLGSPGLVGGSIFLHADGDERVDLAVACQWGPVRLYRNTGEGWEERTAASGLGDRPGWWTGLAAGDFDGDGRTDLAAGNRGANTALAAWPAQAWRLWHGPQGWAESYRDGEGRWMPMTDRTVLAQQFPGLHQAFPTHAEFGQASIGDLYSGPLSSIPYLEAVETRSGVFLDRGERFEFVPFPPEAQRSPVYSVNAGDLDGDGREDLFLGQNDFNEADRTTRNDAGRSLVLRGLGGGRFQAMDARDSGIALYGRVRGAALADVDQDMRLDLAVAEINEPAQLFLNRRGRPGYRVRLEGPPGNPFAVGARLRLAGPGGRKGPLRQIHAGSGFGSQDTLVPVLGWDGAADSIWVRWPDGREEERGLEAAESRVVLRWRPEED